MDLHAVSATAKMLVRRRSDSHMHLHTPEPKRPANQLANFSADPPRSDGTPDPKRRASFSANPAQILGSDGTPDGTPDARRRHSLCAGTPSSSTTSSAASSKKPSKASTPSGRGSRSRSGSISQGQHGRYRLSQAGGGESARAIAARTLMLGNGEPMATEPGPESTHPDQDPTAATLDLVAARLGFIAGADEIALTTNSADQPDIPQNSAAANLDSANLDSELENTGDFAGMTDLDLFALSTAPKRDPMGYKIRGGCFQNDKGLWICDNYHMMYWSVSAGGWKPFNKNNEPSDHVYKMENLETWIDRERPGYEFHVMSQEWTRTEEAKKHAEQVTKLVRDAAALTEKLEQLQLFK